MKRILFLMMIVLLAISSYAVQFSPVTDREDVLSTYHVTVTGIDSVGTLVTNSQYSSASVYLDIPKYALHVSGYDASSVQISWDNQVTWENNSLFDPQAGMLSTIHLSHFYQDVTADNPVLKVIGLKVSYVAQEDSLPSIEPISYSGNLFLTRNPDEILIDDSGTDFRTHNKIFYYAGSPTAFRRIPIVFIYGCNIWDVSGTNSPVIDWEDQNFPSEDNFEIDNCHSFGTTLGGDAVDYFSIKLANSTQFVETNAGIVESAINRIATFYQTTYPNSFVEGFSVIGFSLGGIIGRYALASMEERGITTYTKSFFSFDSPNRGAQINLNLINSPSIDFPAPTGNKTRTDLHDKVEEVLTKDALKQIIRSNCYANYQSGYNVANPIISYLTPSNEYLKLFGKLNVADNTLGNAILPPSDRVQILNGTGFPSSQNHIRNYAISNGSSLLNDMHNNYLDTRVTWYFGPVSGSDTNNGEIIHSTVDCFPGSTPGYIRTTFNGMEVVFEDNVWTRVDNMWFDWNMGGAFSYLKFEYEPTLVPLYSSLNYQFVLDESPTNDLSVPKMLTPTSFAHTNVPNFNETLTQTAMESHGTLNGLTKYWIWNRIYQSNLQTSPYPIGDISGTITCQTLGNVPLQARLMQPGMVNADWGTVPIDSNGHFIFSGKNFEITNSIYELRIEGEGLATKIYHVASNYQPNGNRVLAQVAYQMDLNTVCIHFLTVNKPNTGFSLTNYQTIQAAVDYAKYTLQENTQITVYPCTTSYAPFIVDPFIPYQVIKLVGITGSNGENPTVQAALTADYLVNISGQYSNTIILDNFHFEGAERAIVEYNDMPKNIIIDHCLFKHQSDYSIYTDSPVTVRNSTFNLGNWDPSPTAGSIYTRGYGGNNALNLSTYPTSVIQNCTFSGNFYDHIIKVGVLLGNGQTSGTRPLLSVKLTGNTFNTVSSDYSTPQNHDCVLIASPEYVIVENNIFFNRSNTTGGGSNLCILEPYHWYQSPTSQRLRIMSNTIFYDKNASGSPQNNLSGIYLHNYFADTKIQNNVIANMQGYGFASTSDITNPLYNFQYNDIYNCTTNLTGIANNNPFWAANHLLSVDPKLNLATATVNPFLPKWDTTVRSPLIDAGNPALTVHDFHPEQSSTFLALDPDNTPLDMGAKPTNLAHTYENWSLPFDRVNQGWNWKGLPVMDMVYAQGKTVNDVFKPSNAAFERITYPGPYSIDNINGTWTDPSYQLSRTMGYKIKCNTSTNLPISGTRVVANTPVNLSSDSHINDGENWLCYWLRNSQDPIASLGTFEPSITMIMTQYWTIARDGHGVWQMPTKKVTLNYGDMVILKCSSDVVGFHWYEKPPQPPIIIPIPKKIEYVQKEEYIPMFLDLTAIQDSLPEELGIMLGEECKGAVVVDSTSIQLNAYIKDLTEEEAANLTFVMEYGTKAPRRICSSYTILSEDSKGGTPKPSIQNPNGVWIKIGGSSGSTPPAVLALHLYQNAPNPFSNQTIINYDLPQKGVVKINIYNIRGQLVMSYLNNADKSGKYQVSWNGKDKNKLACSSGIYFCSLETQGQRIIKKMLLLK